MGISFKGAQFPKAIILTCIRLVRGASFAGLQSRRAAEAIWHNAVLSEEQRLPSLS